LETKIDAGNDVSHMAKLINVGETCTRRYIKVSGNIFSLALLKLSRKGEWGFHGSRVA